MIARRALLLLLLASPALAQGAASTPWNHEIVQSTKLGEARTVYVATPASYAQGRERYPVLVLLDANDQPQFAAAVANVAFLTSRSVVPSMIIVGIANGRDRTHDMTPAPDAETAKNFPTAGGAAAFTDFIVDEALPAVRAKYRTLPTTILAGHSFGGMFALHVAATRPGAFAGYIAMSPSLWWNDSTVAVSFADAIAKSPAPSRIYATSGGLEPPIASTTRRFAARLDSIKPARLAFASRHYPDDTHGLTPAPSLMHGLRFVFEPLSLANAPFTQLGPTTDSAAVVASVLATEESYARGARDLGMPEKLPESVLNNLGYAAIQFLKKPNVAVWAFRRNASRYPNSPNVYDSLGDGLLAAGDTSAAVAQFRQSRDVALRVGQPVSNETRTKLETLERAVQAGKPKP